MFHHRRCSSNSPFFWFYSQSISIFRQLLFSFIIKYIIEISTIKRNLSLSTRNVSFWKLKCSRDSLTEFRTYKSQLNLILPPYTLQVKNTLPTKWYVYHFDIRNVRIKDIQFEVDQFLSEREGKNGMQIRSLVSGFYEQEREREKESFLRGDH